MMAPSKHCICTHQLLTGLTELLPRTALLCCLTTAEEGGRSLQQHLQPGELSAGRHWQRPWPTTQRDSPGALGNAVSCALRKVPAHRLRCWTAVLARGGCWASSVGDSECAHANMH
jgi:hypothetical protein